MDSTKLFGFFAAFVLLVSMITAQVDDEASSNLERRLDHDMVKRRGCIGWTRYRNKCNRGRKRFLTQELDQDLTQVCIKNGLPFLSGVKFSFFAFIRFLFVFSLFCVLDGFLIMIFFSF